MSINLLTHAIMHIINVINFFLINKILSGHSRPVLEKLFE